MTSIRVSHFTDATDEVGEPVGRLQRRVAPGTAIVTDVAEATLVDTEASPARVAFQMDHQDGSGSPSPSAHPLRDLAPCHPATETRWTG